MTALVPQPQQINHDEGRFVLTPSTKIIASPGAESQGAYLADLLASEPTTGSGDDNAIDLVLDPDASMHDEGYQLVITPERVTIAAPNAQGLFYGIQTLRQLLPAAVEANDAQQMEWTLPALTIDDYPRYGWRGLMLDVGRYMFSVADVKRFIDLMALHKYNIFHWHLTEDQGWRIEIKQHPRLTEVGALRASSPPPADRDGSDNTPHSGFYTHDDVREIVAYAAARGITVVPEIEMPGHVTAALAAYPHLGCRGEGYEVSPSWSIKDDVFCAGNEDVFSLLEDVLTEVFDLFPSKFIHIGGDECPKREWRSCPKCQARIATEGLADEDELQSYFIRRMEGFLNANGRRLVGWDEILEGGLAPNATVMSWRGSQGGIDAATAGHDVVMTPNTHCYLDYYQSANWDEEPPAIGRFIPLARAYEFDPVAGIPADKHDHVLGGQGNVWTEYMPTNAQVEYMTYPRACALAEAMWTAADDRSFDEFEARLAEHLARLDVLNVNYRPQS